MTKTTRQGFFQPKTLALAVALGTAAPAYAVNFNIGELEGQFDSSMSVGASWSMADRDMDLVGLANGGTGRSEEHTSELQSLMRISYAVFCLKKKKRQTE